MVDRIVELQSIPEKEIAATVFDWYLDQEYIVPEAIVLNGKEVNEFRIAAEDSFDYFRTLTEKILEERMWKQFSYPIAMREMIQHSLEENHKHILGRFDFAGGINELPIGLLEFNADTCTMLPEASYFQDFFQQQTFKKSWRHFNFLIDELRESFKDLLAENPDKNPTLLVTSLGHIEDQLNCKVIVDAALEAGFEAVYADLELVVFENDGIYIEFEDGEDMQFDFMYKLIPWEFIMYEEPELLEILRNLQLNDRLYIMNPAYSVLMQSKAILPLLYETFSSNEIILPAYYDKSLMGSLSYVEKVTFGRMGENIRIYDGNGEIIEETAGDFGNFDKIYQKFSPLYADEEGDYYQVGVYVVNGKACGMSFRRSEGLIVNDDAEFIPYFVETK